MGLGGQEAYTPRRDDLNNSLSSEERALLQTGHYSVEGDRIVAADADISVQTTEETVRTEQERETNLGD